MPENNTHDGNYKGTKNMKAENQNMEFVNDTIQAGEDKHGFKEQPVEKRQGRKP